MGRCRFVTPGIVRIPIASLYETRLADLKARKPKKATKAELDGAEQALAFAREDAEWLDVKTELNAGESKKVYTDLLPPEGVIPGQPPRVTAGLVGVTKVLAYVTRWSFVDAQGEPSEISLETLNLMDPDCQADVIAVVEAHDERVEAERAARKNVRAGGTASSPTSGSLSGLVGPSTLSAH